MQPPILTTVGLLEFIRRLNGFYSAPWLLMNLRKYTASIDAFRFTGSQQAGWAVSIINISIRKPDGNSLNRCISAVML
nr:hypothetical protein [Escherichia coli]